MGLSCGDYRRVLELVAEALRCAKPDFPDMTVTDFLRQVLDADFAGAGEIDLQGTASRRWADSPYAIPMNPREFHEFAVNHPLVQAYQHGSAPEPLRLSDVASSRRVRPTCDNLGMSHVLTIPLVVTPQYLCAIGLMRSGLNFSTRNLELARQLNPVLSGIYAIRHCIADRQPAPCDIDIGIPLTARELAVLDLMADGLIAAAIARRLCISPRTVSKHIQNIYRKLNTHDRTSTVLRGQAMGFVHSGFADARI